MGGEHTHDEDIRGTTGADTPGPVPPKPRHAPDAARRAAPAPHAADTEGGAAALDTRFTRWLRAPRPEVEPGTWRLGHRPRAQRAPEAGEERSLASGAILTFLVCVLLWSLYANGYVPYATVPVRLFTPRDWWGGLEFTPVDGRGRAALEIYHILVAAALLWGFARLGRWRTAFDRLIAARGRTARAAGAATGAAFVLLIIFTGTVPVYDLLYGHLSYAPEDAALTGALSYPILAAIWLGVLVPFARLGGVLPWRRGGRPAAGPERAGAQARDASQAPVPAGDPRDPAGWPALRAAGLLDAAERLTAEIGADRMNDVDWLRIRRAFDGVVADPTRRPAFAGAVRDRGAAACVHPSGDRDLPARAARHDLLTRQVRLGTVADTDRNPWPRRGSGVALDPEVLGTSLLAVGPAGSGKTARLVRPVVESLALQALAGHAAVIVVAAAGTRLGEDAAFDVVVRLGDPGSAHDLDLYGGAGDPDEAASLLAEALVGDIAGVDTRRAATVLAQLLGPFRTAHGRYPAVPELRELLDHLPPALDRLRRALEGTGQSGMLRELDARERQYGGAGDPGPLLADRIALLDRPAFAEFFDTSGRSRPFSLRSLEHPLRVRVDLPERAHAEASRMLARLVLAQFTASVAARTDRSLFAFLVLDDAAHTLTREAVRGIQRLRTAHAGVLLALRSLDDVAEELRTPLLGAVGGRMAFSGVTTWDGKRFAEAWGTEWVETRDVTSRQVFADQPLTRAIHSFRKLVTGKAVTTDAVTVRQVERERWSASDLAHAVPAGAAVLSLTTVRGERCAPLLVELGDA
ncbi:ATP/GTP-binding protein [Streptomyces sp. BI20]|uniref:ATP/GTP-binding protein n=1 Tax=Streptomyces sp. BI20 TaxID=3403460 RepID=UPI003C727D00